MRNGTIRGSGTDGSTRRNPPLTGSVPFDLNDSALVSPSRATDGAATARHERRREIADLTPSRQGTTSNSMESDAIIGFVF